MNDIILETRKNNPIAQFVKKRRKEAGFTQVKFADFTGIGLPFLRKVEQGKLNVNAQKLNDLLAFFGSELGAIPKSD